MLLFVFILIFGSVCAFNISKNSMDNESVLEINKLISKIINRSSYERPVYMGLANNPFSSSTRLYLNHLHLNFSDPYREPENSIGQDETKERLTGTEDMLEVRSKRGVLQLYNMVSCATQCDPLTYKGYGCYCGFLGSGRVVDEIDSCCKSHDVCYEYANCLMFLEYVVPYYWTCANHQPICALRHGVYGGVGSCAQRLCECDRKLSNCLRRYPCPSSRALCHSSPLRLFQNLFMNY